MENGRSRRWSECLGSARQRARFDMKGVMVEMYGILHNGAFITCLFSSFCVYAPRTARLVAFEQFTSNLEADVSMIESEMREEKKKTHPCVQSGRTS